MKTHQKFMDVENEAGSMTNEKQDHNHRQNHRLLSFIGLLLLSRQVSSILSRLGLRLLRSVGQLATSFHHPVDPIVQEDQANERNDSLNQEPRDVCVNHHVDVIEPQFRGGRPSLVVLPGHIDMVGLIGVLIKDSFFDDRGLASHDHFDLQNLGNIEEGTENDDG